MAANHWLGATTPGDFNVAGNFSDGVPTAGDDLKALSENTSQVGPTANPAAHTLILLNSLYIGPGYTQTWGGSGAHIQISSEIVIYQGTAGKLWLKEGTNAGGTANVVCDSSSSSPLSHDCLQLTDTLFDRLAVIRGMCTLESGCAVGDITLGSRNGNTVESKLVINTGAVAPTGRVTVHNGIGSCSIQPTTLIMLGGTWIQEAGGAIPTTIEMWGGNLVLKTGGTCTTGRHFGGTIDCTQGGGLHTFTNYFRLPGAVLLGEGNVALVSLPTAQPALTYIS
jgi:hypothetical protein